tara:strand:- start:258 stop:3095 length:2838 start_codon:yes stop_codon:yes gene_type:complete
MKRPGGGCNFKKTLRGDMNKVALSYTKNETMKKAFGMEIDNVVKKVFEDVFDMPWDARSAVDYTKGRIRTFENRLWRVENAIKQDKLSSKFGSLFYAPSSLIKSNPQLGRLMDNLHNVNLEYAGRRETHNRQFKNIIDHMRKQMLIDGYNTNEMFPNMSAKRRLNKAVKEADKFDKKIEDLSLKVTMTNSPADKKNLSNAIKAENKFYTKGEGKVFNEIVNTIERKIPKLEQEALDQWRIEYKKLEKKRIPKAEFNKRKRKALNITLAKEIKSEPMRNAVAEYIILMDDMYDVLTKGITAYGKSIKASMKNKYEPKVVDDIVEKIITKITPDKQKGYFPHYKRVLNKDFLENLMPHMQKVSDILAGDFQNNKAAADDAIKELNTFVTGRTKARRKIDVDEFDPATEYSRNFFTTVKRYVDEIDRFNMISHADQYTRESLLEAKELFKSGKHMNNFGRATVEMMKDMNARMKGGYGFENETTEKMMKSLLALEFTSKLGFNLRSPFKNATQGLLNIVEFSPSQMMKMGDFYERRIDFKGRKLSSYVNDLMEESGFLFADDSPPELLQSQFSGKNFTQKIKITENETVELQKPSWFTPIHDKTQKLAGKSGYLMAKVENYNRKTTFKLGFMEMYDKLNNSTAYKNELRDKNMSELEIDNKIKHISKNYALRKTSLLHFDYTDLGKASWLTHPAGRLIGQFQHYSVKFFEYNMDIARNGKDDILAGEVLGDRAKKAYTMAMVYSIAPVIASIITGVDFTNIVENDMIEKMKKMATLFTGDEEDIKSAFYGKGVATGLPFIGAPVISDMLAIGNILNFIDMDDDMLNKMIIGYEDYNLASKDKKVYEIIRTLNVQAGRAGYRTLPLLREGKFGSALQYELGLYPTKTSRELQKKAAKKATEVAPGVMNALDLLKAHQKKALSPKTLEPADQGPPVRNDSYFNPDEGYFK